jgi:hypothetical protein
MLTYAGGEPVLYALLALYYYMLTYADVC